MFLYRWLNNIIKQILKLSDFQGIISDNTHHPIPMNVIKRHFLENYMWLTSKKPYIVSPYQPYTTPFICEKGLLFEFDQYTVSCRFFLYYHPFLSNLTEWDNQGVMTNEFFSVILQIPFIYQWETKILLPFQFNMK